MVTMDSKYRESFLVEERESSGTKIEQKYRLHKDISIR